METSPLLELSARIVSAQAQAGKIDNGEIPLLIQQVHQTLSSLLTGTSTGAGGRIPIVSVEQSIQDDRVYCLDCGAGMKMLRRHLRTEHGLSPEQYRERWALAASYPLVAPNYSNRRAELALESGLGKKR